MDGAGAAHHAFVEHALDDAPDTGMSRFNTPSKLTLVRYLQGLNEAEVPHSLDPPKYHTGKLPNSKAQDGRPRLLLMGQRRYGFVVIEFEAYS